jgi:hypothetical protein
MYFKVSRLLRSGLALPLICWYHSDVSAVSLVSTFSLKSVSTQRHFCKDRRVGRTRGEKKMDGKSIQVQVGL